MKGLSLRGDQFLQALQPSPYVVFYVPMVPGGDESPLHILCSVCLGRYLLGSYAPIYTALFCLHLEGGIVQQPSGVV